LAQPLPKIFTDAPSDIDDAAFDMLSASQFPQQQDDFPLFSPYFK
jgi:hypothetical protein